VLVIHSPDRYMNSMSVNRDIHMGKDLALPRAIQLMSIGK
jgi:hypothetical protein